MRKEMRSSIRANYITISLTIFILLFLNILIIAPRSIAQRDQLNIHITDNNGYPINEIFEELRELIDKRYKH